MTRLRVVLDPVYNNVTESIDRLRKSRRALVGERVASSVGLHRNSKRLVARLTRLKHNVLLHAPKGPTAFRM